MDPEQSWLAGLIRKYEGRSPRYTSYPPIPFWRPVDPRRVAGWLESPRLGPLSLYVHVPFCRSQCLYCGCLTVISPKPKPVPPYLEALFHEMNQVAGHVGRGRPVRQFHIGGGTPTYLDERELASLMEQVHRLFALDPSAEQSIEIDPRTVSPRYLTSLRALGFNRLSLGVQDFDAGVQAQVRRIQTPRQVARLVEAARALEYRSVNFDLIYGLPGQTRQTFAHTLDQVMEIVPDRIALYPFAYLPSAFSHQRKLAADSLPGAEEKLAIFLAARERLTGAGYTFIGMDHFALRNDALSVALREGTLQRNFMGYTTQAGSDLIGLGVSAISEVQGRYWQNEKRLSRYETRVGEGMLPAARGLELSADDRLRKEVIAALLCQGRVDLGVMGSRHGMDLWTHFGTERQRLDELERDDLLYAIGKTITVTETGRLLLRSIAQAFDAYAPMEHQAVTLSKTV